MAPVPTDPTERLIGRDDLVGRIRAALDPGPAGRCLTLVSGAAGIGKSSVVRVVAASAGADGAAVGWGTCVEGGSVPGYWPWTQALEDLVRCVGRERARAAAGEDARQLVALIPAFGAVSTTEATDRDRLLLWDAVARLLEALAADQAVIVVIDDVQWADESSVALFDFLASTRQRAAVHLIGAYRDEDVPTELQQDLARLVSHANHIVVPPLNRQAVTALVHQVAGPTIDDDTIERIFRRAGGQPFFTRELALLAATGNEDEIPVAVRGAISRRLDRVTATTRAVLDVAAVMGTPLRRDILATAAGLGAGAVDQALAAATRSGIIVARPQSRFAHDLYREAILEAIPSQARAQLHLAIAGDLERRATRNADIAPAEIAFHATAAISIDGAARAGRWALAAAADDASSFAFTEAAAHLRRWRASIAEADADVDDEILLDILLAEAQALGHAGNTLDARGLLRMARDIATRCGSATHLAQAALCTAQLGGQFAMRRDEVVAELDAAREVVAAVDVMLEARVTATLARELQHSVADDRPRAGPLSQHALALGRAANDPATLLYCLLARHDVLWTPGNAEQREPIAREIVDLARRDHDQGRLAEGLLLVANALLEQGAAAFLAPLEECLGILDQLGQPRDRYLAATRRTTLALLRGDLCTADASIRAAAALGERIREPDTGNVAMSQRLELVRARGQPDEFRAFADQAVTHWSGAPVHAHAVAAGFNARAGDVDAARHHAAAVVDLGGWRVDRSYLWSVFVRELAVAAIALDDRGMCAALLDDLLPLAGSCGVNGAVVAFAGSHAHTAGLLAAALEYDVAPSLLEQARRTYERLGAYSWLADLDQFTTDTSRPATPVMKRNNTIWEITYGGQRATVPHSKGLNDIATLISRRGDDVHVLELTNTPVVFSGDGALVDRGALGAYRRRLADLDDDLAEAEAHRDTERAQLLEGEREALLSELRRVTGVGGRARSFANHPAERARKAVAARIRETIKKLHNEIPALAAHLDAAIVTGTYCRYRPPQTPSKSQLAGDQPGRRPAESATDRRS
jgi:AAA ATPase domain